MKTINRRTFCRVGAGATLAGLAASTTRPLWAQEEQENRDEAKAAPVEAVYRTLGRTGLLCSILGFGAMRTSDPGIIRRAIEMGVNNIDTARGYMDGENEVIVGKAIKGLRDSLVITSKIRPASKERMIADVEASLKALGTDHLDILLLHSAQRISDIHQQESLEALNTLKESGKTRFIGFSTHKNMASLLSAAAENEENPFDVILVVYNFTTDDDVAASIAKAAKAGIGIIAMKTQAGGYKEPDLGNLNPHQAALKWVLTNPDVTCAIPAMVTYDQLEENIKVMDSSFGWMDRKTLHRYGRAIDHKLCRFCGACEDQCPHGVSVADISRCLMYNDGYGDARLARSAYAEQGVQTLEACQNCHECVVRCAYGLPIAENVQRARTLFA
ncbi:aldo/keto reductase [candidate division KSB1 bacterium]|nr:aldo/keto reductase [candidate division KSB1 bacterium]